MELYWLDSGLKELKVVTERVFINNYGCFVFSVCVLIWGQINAFCLTTGCFTENANPTNIIALSIFLSL